MPYVTSRWTLRERRRVTVPAAATPLSRTHSPATMNISPTIQRAFDMWPGTSNGTPRKRTGSQPRFRNSTAPRRAERLRSESETGGEEGVLEVDIVGGEERT